MNTAVYATDLGQPEGPFSFPDGRLVLVEMAKNRGCVTELGTDNSWRRRIARTGRPNAVISDAQGALWVAESFPDAGLLRIDSEGDVSVVATSVAGRPLLFPNDLVIAADGMLYLTDSGILLDEWAPGGQIDPHFRDLPIDGRVIRVDPSTGETELVDDGIAFANGIAVNAEGDLFANEMVTGNVFRYEWDPALRRFGSRQLFGSVPATDAEADVTDFAGPDGMKFDAQGNLLCTVYGMGIIAVLGPDGEPREAIKTQGRLPSNLAFAADGSSTVYVTECELGQIETFSAAFAGGPVFTRLAGSETGAP